VRGTPDAAGRHVDGNDQIASIEDIVALRRLAGKTMETGERDRSLPIRAVHDDLGIEGGQPHRHIGRMGGDTSVRPPEDGVIAIHAVKRGAARTRAPFVAREAILVAEIGASRALHDVAANRRHVAQLSGCGEQQRLREDRKAGADLRMRGHVAHAGERTDPQTTVRQRVDPGHVRNRVDVQQTFGQSRAVLDQAEEIGAAGDEGELRILGMGGARLGGIIGPGEGKHVHGQCLPAASATASTMLG
jgi:hypothetical protein